MALNGMNEQTFNLCIANRVRSLVENYQTCIMTRTWEMKDIFLELKDRTDKAHAFAVDRIISIHCNAFTNQQPNGLEIFFKPGCKFSEFLARKMYDNVYRAAMQAGYNYTGRGVKGDKNFWMLTRGPKTAPAVLIECGFLTNPADLEWLISPVGQITIGYGIAKTLLEVK